MQFKSSLLQRDYQEHTAGINYIHSLSLGDASYLCATASDDRSIKFWRYLPYQEAPLSCIYAISDAHEGDVECAKFFIFENQVYVVSCAYDITCKVWLLNLNGGGTTCDHMISSHKLQQILVGHSRPVWTHDIAEYNGKLVVVTGGVDNTLQYYSDALNRPSCDTVMSGHSKAVRCVQFATNNSSQLTCISGSYDNQLIEWNVLDGTRLRTFDKHLHPSTIIVLHVNVRKNLLFTACFDSRVREFVYDTGDLCHTYSGDNPVFGMDLTEKHLIFGGTNKQIIVYDRQSKQKQKTIRIEHISKRINAAIMLNDNTIIVAHGNTVSVLPPI